MKLIGDVGMELVLKRVELHIASLKQMSPHGAQFILGNSLNISLGVEELHLCVEGVKVHELFRDSSISRNHKFKGWWKLPHAGVKLVQQRDEVLAVGTDNSMLPGHVIQLDHAASAVQHKSKCFHDGSPKQHRSFARQQVHLDVAILATDAEWQSHSPCAVQLGITSKEEGAVTSLELHLGDVLLGLLELEHVAQEGTIARQESTGTGVQHGTIMALTPMGVGVDHEPMLLITHGALSGRLALGCCASLRDWAIVGHVTNLSAAQASGRCATGFRSPLWIGLFALAPGRVFDCCPLPLALLGLPLATSW